MNKALTRRRRNPTAADASDEYQRVYFSVHTDLQRAEAIEQYRQRRNIDTRSEAVNQILDLGFSTLGDYQFPEYIARKHSKGGPRLTPKAPESEGLSSQINTRFSAEVEAELTEYQQAEGIPLAAAAVRELVAEGLKNWRRRQQRRAQTA